MLGGYLTIMKFAKYPFSRFRKNTVNFLVNMPEALSTISMVEAKCIAVGNRLNEFLRINKDH